MTERYESRASTHADDCWSWGPAHYECAVGKIERMRAEIERLRAERDALAQENELLRKDAERYRWLKKSAFCNVWARGDGIALVVPQTPTASIDSKIDAEMAMENSDD